MPKNPLGAMSQFVMRNPFTAAAAVFAPLFAQNEDRGYFRTALITTPVIFAANEFIPKTFGTARDVARTAVETRNLLQKAEKWTRFDQRVSPGAGIFRDSNAPTDTVNRMTADWLVSQKRASRDYLREQKVLNKLWNRKFVVTDDLIKQSEDLNNPKTALAAQTRIAEIERLQSEKGYLITKALQSSRKASLTTAEWANEVLPTWEGPNTNAMSNDEMMKMFNEYQTRPEFVKSLKNRLREVQDLNYGGTIDVAAGPVGSAGISSHIGFDDFSSAERVFKAQAPEAYEALEKAVSLNRSIEVSVLSEDVVSGRIGRVLSYTIKRKERDGNIKELVVPIVDPATGSVSLGGATGVGDFVIDANMQPNRLDSWVARQLVENPMVPLKETYPGEPSLQGEIDAHAYWHAGDPMDARRMAELKSFGESAGQFSARARKLRSHAAKFSKLPIFLDEDGNLKTYHDLGPAAQQAYVKKTFNSNLYIPMGSDAGIYEGRFVMREAEWLSPYGAPSAERQDSIWRAATKEFELRAPDGLPSEAQLGWRSTAWGGLMGGDMPAAKAMIGSIDPQTRTALIEELRASGRNDLAASFGKMGETGAVINEQFANNFTVEGISKYRVNELGVKVGDTVDPTSVLGFLDDKAAVPKHLGTVTDIHRVDEGFDINVRHELGLQGGKFDIAGVKGMIAESAPNEHFQQMRALVNDYSRRMGTGDVIPDSVNMLMPAEYFANKVEPAHAQLGIGSELVNRLIASDHAEVAEPYLLRMKSELGTTFQDGQLVIDAARLQADITMDATTRLRKLTEISEDFFRQAGEAIRSAGGYQDPVLSAYVNSGKEIGDWMLKNQLPGMMFTWDHSLVNAPRFASITHDISTFMSLGQNYAGLRAIQSRAVTTSTGDARQSLEFMKHVMGGKFDQPFGNVVGLGDAFPGEGDLSKARARADSIFDPSLDKYKDNFSVKVGNEYIPVPGTAAYGAEGNMIAPGEYRTTRWQNTLQRMSEENNPEKLAELRGTLINQYQEVFGTGKGSVLRPYMQDPMSIAGVFSTAAEEANPFTARISPELAKKVRSKRLRDALMRGEEVMGALHRQPTNQMLYMKFKVDEALRNTMDVAVAERISRAYIGDQDKDTAYALLFDANVRSEQGKTIIASQANAIEGAAAAEAFEAIEGGRQMEYLKAWESVKGRPEVANQITDFAMTPLSKRAGKFADRVGNRLGVAINRMAGAAIGPYSNVLTEIEEHMVRNPAVQRDSSLAARLNAMMFDIRQAPISARKAPSFDLVTAQMHLGRFKKALAEPNPAAAADKLHNTLMSIGQTLNPEFGKSSEYKYMTEQALEDLQAFTRGRSPEATLMRQAFTNIANPAKPFEGSNAKRVVERAFENVESTLGSVHGGMSASTESASKLGVFAEGLAEMGRARVGRATGAIGNIFSRHGKAMAMGLGALAALGIAMTPNRAPIATFSRGSGNAFRPEERMGVADHVPGEPVPGQMAPSNPPRRIVPAQPGVRKAVIAPMGQTSDLSVRMRAEDQSRAAETARQISQIPGNGDTNVTVNYRDRTKLRSLRTRERIREMR